MFHQQVWSFPRPVLSDGCSLEQGQQRQRAVGRRQTVHDLASGSRRGLLRDEVNSPYNSVSGSAAGSGGLDQVEIELATKRRKSFDYSELSNVSSSS